MLTELQIVSNDPRDRSFDLEALLLATCRSEGCTEMNFLL